MRDYRLSRSIFPDNLSEHIKLDPISNTITRALVIGGLGQVGRLFAQSMRNSGISVTIADSRRLAVSPLAPEEYIECDVRSPSPDLIAALHSSDCVCVCLPETVTIEAVASVLPLMSTGSLWVDTLSVKTAIAHELERHVQHCEILSINPMFAPELGWNKHAVAAVEICSGPKARALYQLISNWGAQVEFVSAIEHDQLTAAIQVATHAAVLAFGDALIHLDFDVTKATHLATPPHRLLLTLLYRLISKNPDVYWDIQTWHPLGTQVRDSLRAGIARLGHASEADGQEQFRNLFEQIQAILESEAGTLRAWSQRLFTPSDS